MTRNRPPLIAIAVAVLGLLAIMGTVVLMRSASTSPPPSQNMAQTAPGPTAAPKIKQFVAAQFIPPRTLITQAMFRSQDTSTPTPGAVTDANLVVGQLAAAPIFAGQAITVSDVNAPLHRVVPANFQIPVGYRAVAIYVDPNSTAAGLVDIGDRVDVILTGKRTVSTEDTEAYQQFIVGDKEPVIGRIVAQDLLVLAVDRSLAAPTPTPTPNPTQAAGPQIPGGAAPAPTATPTPAPAPSNGNGQGVKVRVILAAMPQVAVHLVAANEAGNLHVAIRDPNSRDAPPVNTVNEMPSRVIQVRKQSFIEGQRILRLGEAKQIAEMRRAEMPPMPVPSTNTGGNTTPTVIVAPTPSGKDVTVIRGTEKTLVTVPNH